MNTQIDVLYRGASAHACVCVSLSYPVFQHRMKPAGIEWTTTTKNDTAAGSSRLPVSSGVMIMMCVCASAFSYSFIFWSVSVVMDFPLSKRNDLCVSHSQYITARTMWTKESKWNKKHTHRMNIWKNRSYFKCHKWMDGANRIAQTVYSAQECIGES